MIQAIVKKGKVIPEEIPAPVVSKGSLLIKVVNSCISAGTEVSGVKSSERSLIKKALEQPEKIAKGLNMVLNDGIFNTYDKIRNTIGAGSVTGYSIAGVVIGTGEGVTGFEVGDHVAAAGAGLANHAEYVDVPQNLVMKLPSRMDFKSASTVTLGGIALQGVRRCDLKLGEFCVVFGAGILGLLSVQILKVSGVRVIVMDLDDRRLKIAKDLGAELIINPKTEDSLTAISNYTGGYGTDAVLFTAATTSSEPLSQSFKMCKKKGKVVLLGVVGLQINREDMYAKELDFIISTSYGPGRYDTNYEQKGLDYPYSYVRWTENRNMTEYLRLVHENLIRLDSLVEGIFPISKVEEAFQSLNSDNKPLMVLLDYGLPTIDFKAFDDHARKIAISNNPIKKELVHVALIGTGGFAVGMHLPNLAKLKDKFVLHAVVNRTGHKAKSVATQFGAKYASTDVNEVLTDKDIDLVFICTRHDSHAELVLKALESGKNVFVEKPLAITQEQLDKILGFYSTGNSENKPLLMVGFNRRFSKYSKEIIKHTEKRIGPLFVRYRMNAGFIDPDSWVHDDGGRIIGEGCHIIDLMNFFTGAEVKSVSFESLDPGKSRYSGSDNKSIVLKYGDGSVCAIDYFSVGNKNFPKEYMEIHFDGKTIVLDDYKSLKGFGVNINPVSSSTSEKGQLEELEVLYESLSGKRNSWPIELWDLRQTTEVALLIKK
jgi:predicted dehydrogenase/threonine dehydrogenase-like Zn-dependent dehydrogenase